MNTENQPFDREHAIAGCLLGTAVGDALGLPCEGFSRARQSKLFPNLDRPHFFFGRGMYSDDTEHTIMAAQALIVSAGDAALFTRSFARQLRVWLLLLPAGAGLATLKAGLKLLCGFSPQRSGVRSAGNGPAMRSALLGVCYGDDPVHLCALVRASTRLTHTDPKAEYGAFAVALAAHFSAHGNVSIEAYTSALREQLGAEGNEFIELVERAAHSAQSGEDAQTFAASIGCPHGVSGYIYHTVPVVLQVWFCHPTSYRSAIEEIIRCGGDADSTAAILGGIIGAGVGPDEIPAEWRSSLCEWPHGVVWMQRLAQRLSEVCTAATVQKPLRAPVIAILLRNVLFLLIVLVHGMRRLLPPY